MFYGHAFELEPSSGFYHARYLSCLADSDPKLAGRMAGQVIADAEHYVAAVVVQAANIRMNEIRLQTDGESVQFYREMIPILAKNMAKIEEGDVAGVLAVAIQSMHSLTAAMLGSCYRFLGDFLEAINSYARGLQFNPNNSGLLVLRGILLYDSLPPDLKDFEQAVRFQSPLVLKQA